MSHWSDAALQDIALGGNGPRDAGQPAPIDALRELRSRSFIEGTKRMTITLTPAEIREHQDRCEQWARKRAVVLQSFVTTVSDPFLFGKTRQEVRADSEEQILLWEKANPFPRLLPAV